MVGSSKLLVLFGYWNGDGKKALKEVKGKGPKVILEKLEKLHEDKTINRENHDIEEFAERYADHHEIELQHNQMYKTPYPNTKQNYHMVWQTFQRPIEAFYFWCLNQMDDLSFTLIDKITDVFAASEHSSMYGVGQQRLSLAQQKVTEFLVSIGRLVRELFQIVRELRILDERTEYYEGTKSSDENVRIASEIALKAIFVELVEGGAKNINSVYGLARELRFTSLPDLFFSIHPKSKPEIKPMVDDLEGFNTNVKAVLIKKLTQYMIWRTNTGREITSRREHTLRYLRQHYNAINLYLQWVKPYLKNIRRLTADQRRLDTKDLIAAFEGSVVEIEIMARQRVKGAQRYYSTLIFTIVYRTSPDMAFQQDYQRGASHRGKAEMMWRSYVWDDEDVKRYKAMREYETFDLLGDIDSSIKDSMHRLGDSLYKYLAQADEKVFPHKIEKEVKKEPEYSIFGPFIALYEGLKDLASPLIPSYKETKGFFKWESTKEREKKFRDKVEFGKTDFNVTLMTWLHYRNFKKAHRLVTW